MGEVIVITSGKGGVGKTTTTANVGTGLAMIRKGMYTSGCSCRKRKNHRVVW